MNNCQTNLVFGFTIDWFDSNNPVFTHPPQIILKYLWLKSSCELWQIDADSGTTLCNFQKRKLYGLKSSCAGLLSWQAAVWAKYEYFTLSQVSMCGNWFLLALWLAARISTASEASRFVEAGQFQLKGIPFAYTYSPVCQAQLRRWWLSNPIGEKLHRPLLWNILNQPLLTVAAPEDPVRKLVATSNIKQYSGFLPDQPRLIWQFKTLVLAFKKQNCTYNYL